MKSRFPSVFPCQSISVLLLCLWISLFLLIFPADHEAGAQDLLEMVASASNGDTVLVDEPYIVPLTTQRGTCEEMAIDTSITIRGTGSSRMLIQSLEWLVQADGITIENFDFTHQKDYYCWGEPGCYDSRILTAKDIDSLEVRNATFRENNIYGLNGGLVLLKRCTNVIFENCWFEYGHTPEGGLVSVEGCEQVVFRNCTFKNGASDSGGLVRVKGGKNISFEDCTFSKGTANSGGGISLYNTDTCTFDNCSFSGSTALDNGGAGDIRQSDAVVFSNCTVSGNNAAPFKDIDNSYWQRQPEFYGYGGAFSVVKSEVTFSNTLFSRNEAHQGGALLLTSSDVLVADCRVANNDSSAVWIVNEATQNVAELVLLLLLLSEDLQGIIEKLAT